MPWGHHALLLEKVKPVPARRWYIEQVLAQGWSRNTLMLIHVRLRCYVVIELKRGDFKPEYAGKMNFYCNLVDDQLRHPDDAPTIGLILCQRNNEVLAEYALRGVEKPIGVSTFELTRALPTALASVLPSIEAIEAELSGSAKTSKDNDELE